MTLRARITLAAALAVAVAVFVSATVVYVAVARTLRAEVDRSLTRIVGGITDNERRVSPARPSVRGRERWAAQAASSSSSTRPVGCWVRP